MLDFAVKRDRLMPNLKNIELLRRRISYESVQEIPNRFKRQSIGVD